MAKKAKKSTKRRASKGRRKRKASTGVLAGAVNAVRKQARKLGL